MLIAAINLEQSKMSVMNIDENSVGSSRSSAFHHNPKWSMDKILDKKIAKKSIEELSSSLSILPSKLDQASHSSTPKKTKPSTKPISKLATSMNIIGKFMFTNRCQNVT
jgi:hypothetical protein